MKRSFRQWQVMDGTINGHVNELSICGIVAENLNTNLSLLLIQIGNPKLGSQPQSEFCMIREDRTRPLPQTIYTSPQTRILLIV